MGDFNIWEKVFCKSHVCNISNLCNAILYRWLSKLPTCCHRRVVQYVLYSRADASRVLRHDSLRLNAKHYVVILCPTSRPVILHLRKTQTHTGMRSYTHTLNPLFSKTTVRLPKRLSEPHEVPRRFWVVHCNYAAFVTAWCCSRCSDRKCPGRRSSVYHNLLWVL